MRIIRVFPRRTKATPVDDLVRIGTPPGLFDEADEVHISVTFTWDLPFAEKLARQWRDVAPVKIGGPATGEKGGDFVPGMYLKNGYVITSRGCHYTKNGNISHRMRCYVLCGFKGDYFNKAQERMKETISAGFIPMAMLYRDKTGKRDSQWMKWART